MDSSSYESSRNLSVFSAIASALPSVFDATALSDILIQENDLIKASELYSLPQVALFGMDAISFPPVFLGSGASYRVYMRKFEEWETPVAIKHVKSRASPGDVENVPSLAEQRLTILREIHTLGQFKGHPNIVNLLGWGSNTLEGAFGGEVNAFLITEYAPLGNLDSFLQERGPALEFEQLLKVCADVAEGIEAMHSRRMVHGDVKTANILIFEDTPGSGQLTAKISDLGFSISLDFVDAGACYRGTDLYNAPEVRGQQPCTLQDLDLLACDVYSFGLLVWTVFKRGDFFLRGAAPSLSGDGMEVQTLDSVGPARLLACAVEFARAMDSQHEATVLEKLFSTCLVVDAAARSSITNICEMLNDSRSPAYGQKLLLPSVLC